jgi:hypothetical protein
MAKGTSLVSRTIKYLIANGYTDIERVQFWNSFTKTRHYKQGLWDIDCIQPNDGLLSQSDKYGCKENRYIEVHIQVCDMGSKNLHLKKFRESATAKRLAQAPCEMLLIAWRTLKATKQDGTKGKRDVWTIEVIKIDEETLK